MEPEEFVGKFPVRKTFSKAKTTKPEEEEKEEEEQVPQVVVVENTTSNTIFFVFWVVLIVSCVTFGVTLYYSEPILQRLRGGGNVQAEWQVHPIHPNRINTESAEALSNTTTPEEMWRVRRALATHLAAYPGRYPCLCMHHLRLSDDEITTVRACATYNPKTLTLEFMLNPRLIGWDKGRGVQQVLEKSIACSYAGYAQRANIAYVEWEDYESITNYMGFRGDSAYCLQLAMEEFKGSKHCPQDDPMKNLVKRNGW